MKKIGSVVATILLLLLFCSGAFADILKFFAWLFTLQYSQPDTSIAGGIIVRILTFIVSYSLVGVIFNALGWFNGKVMKIVYFVISTLLGFVIAYTVWGIEQYILIIGIVMGVIVLAAIAYFVIRAVLDKKKQPSNVKEE
ncbi:MAG: hypothetical protein VB122_02070 [Erysipelotrichales bacterium]|nr:hypothetical protein [Erysipelotrichales bacterium]